MYSSERYGCGATIKLESGEIVIISVARSSVFVRLNKGLLGSLFGPILFKEKDLNKVAGTAIMLALQYPNRAPSLPEFKNPVLANYTNAIWNCATAAEVTTVFSQAAYKASVEDVIEAAAMLAAFQGAKNLKPNSSEVRTCRVFYSDGKNQITRLTPSEIATWPVESNTLFESEVRPYRITHITDEGGATVWQNS